MLLTVEQWISRSFVDGSRPTRRTVWRWIRDGRLPARKIGKRYYLDQSVQLTPHHTDGWRQLVDNVA